jgi:hypothetical protein
VGAVVLAIATMTAIVFAILNFDQRQRFESPDDGVSWLDTSRGVEAWHIAPDSPAQKAGIRAGDKLLEINGTVITSQIQATKRLWRAGLWAQVRYKLARNGEEFETLLVTAPPNKPASIDSYLRFAGLLYLFIGICGLRDCFICSSDFLCCGRGGTRRERSTFTFFVLCRLFSVRSTTAENWTRSTMRCIGRKLWRGCLRRRFCCISHWYSRSERSGLRVLCATGC